MKEKILKLHKDSLFRNSFYLMLATAVMAGFGFFFWLISARLFAIEHIGLATTLISVMNLIATLSLIGFNGTFVRFLPKSEKPNDDLNTGMILVGIAAFILSGMFIVFVKKLSPNLSFIGSSPLISASFIIFCIMTALNILTDSVFLSKRQTKFTLIINTIFSAVKMVLPFAFIGWGAIGIFSAAALGQTLGFVLSVAVMIWKFEYRPKFTIRMNVIKRVWKYSTSNYVAGIFSLLPMTLLPVIITNRLSPEDSGYFYIVMMIANLLYVIPRSTTSSLFAESSNDEYSLIVNLKKSIKIISILLIPTMLVLIFGAETILRIFGKGYATGGANFLQLVTLTGVAVSTNAVFGALFSIQKNLRSIVIFNIIYAVATISLSYALLPLDLAGIGIAWLVGNFIAGLSAYILYRLPKNFFKEIRDLFYDVEALLFCKFNYLKALFKNGFKTKNVFCYPETPKLWHGLYYIFHILGYKFTSDSSIKSDLMIFFEDTTVRKEYPILNELRQTNKIININCADISKEKVEKIFKETFGYSAGIDPRFYSEKCVKKSNRNGMNDGKIIACPSDPEDGFVYQKIINNQKGDTVTDYRVIIVGNQIPLVIQRYRDINVRFSKNKKTVAKDTSECFNPDEISKILTFCRNFGMDYGELDIVRDGDDNRIYIVDANNTPALQRHVQGISKDDYYQKYTKKVAQAFEAEFANINKI